MTYANKIKQGHCVYARRGDEWLLIKAAAESDENNNYKGQSDKEALWLYGTGNVGNGRTIAPMDVVDSQLMAHVDHGWKVVDRL
tara:strand:+ start:591 stop:842 length:252 start_codon:yes stop_codon:yes gene_type:complete